MDSNFQDIDIILPHPVYAWMSWIAVLNPGSDTFEHVKPLIDETCNLALNKWKKKRDGRSKTDKL